MRCARRRTGWVRPGFFRNVEEVLFRSELARFVDGIVGGVDDNSVFPRTGLASWRVVFAPQREMEDEESEKVQSMVAPKPAMVPRRMQFGADQSSSATSAKEGEDGAWGVVPAGGLGAGTAGAARKSEAVYTPASDPLLEVRA